MSEKAALEVYLKTGEVLRYLHLIDCETWSDDLADEGELSDEVGAAVDALNAVLKAQGPSCWYPGKQRINMEPLWAELKADLEKENQ